MKLSCPTLNWVLHDAAVPTARFDLETIFEAAANAGFSSVGIDAVTMGVQSGDAVAELLAKNGLRCTDFGVLPIGLGDELETARRFASTIEAVGTSRCITAVLAPPSDPEIRRILEGCAEIISGAGARLAVEFTAYNPVNSLTTAVEVCEQLGEDRAGVLVDSWHFVRTGEPWDTLAGLASQQIAHVHVNDGPSSPVADAVLESRTLRELPGLGAFPLARFRDALDAIGYAGSVSPEVLSLSLRNEDPGTACLDLMAALQRFW